MRKENNKSKYDFFIFALRLDLLVNNNLNWIDGLKNSEKKKRMKRVDSLISSNTSNGLEINYYLILQALLDERHFS
jgi:hypothetical protein